MIFLFLKSHCFPGALNSVCAHVSCAWGTAHSRGQGWLVRVLSLHVGVRGQHMGGQWPTELCWPPVVLSFAQWSSLIQPHLLPAAQVSQDVHTELNLHEKISSRLPTATSEMAALQAYWAIITLWPFFKGRLSASLQGLLCPRSRHCLDSLLHCSTCNLQELPEKGLWVSYFLKPWTAENIFHSKLQFGWKAL